MTTTSGTRVAAVTCPYVHTELRNWTTYYCIANTSTRTSTRLGSTHGLYVDTIHDEIAVVSSVDRVVTRVDQGSQEGLE